MYNQTLYNGLINVVPFWSSNIIGIFGFGNEYNMAINLILSELLKITTRTFNDIILIAMTFLIAIGIIGYQYGFRFNINLFEKNIIRFIGKEISNNTGLTLEYCDKILIINDYLLNIKKIKNITYVDDINIIINDIFNYKITPQINLSITRINENKKSDNNCVLYSTNVIYELSSYSCNIEKFTMDLVLSHKIFTNSEITLIGDENNKIISYPEPIHAINYFVNKNFQFPKLKCMKLRKVSNDDDINSNSNSNSNNKNEKTIKNKINSKKLNNYSYTLDNINNFNLGKVFLTINRDGFQVIYYIKSHKVNCKEWLDELINDYNQNKNLKFKNKLVLTGREEIWLKDNSFKNYFYSKAMWTINWLLIDRLNYQNYECVNGDEKVLMYKYVLEPLELFKIQDDLFLTVEKENRSYWYSSYENNKHNNNMDIIYTLYSNSLNIKDILENYVSQFDIYKNKISSNKILYHFTYIGMKNEQLQFNSKVLSESNTDRELFETFDKIHNEHVDFLKKDIDKLKDFEYYKKHGLKRKKGYLFHGIPGCGKTSSVVAMALYDSRHIVEISFSLLTTHQEFEKIMELKSINNIEIDNNNIILLFDEIDIGMEKISSRNNESNLDSIQNNTENNIKVVNKAVMSYNYDTFKNNINEVVDKAVMSYNYDTFKNTTEQKINLGTLLSKLDGIGNYNGLIVIGTTNYIQKLDPALYRELRLTPIKFDKLRKEDCIKIIQSYFGLDYNEQLNLILSDRKITPTKLIHLCHQYENRPINDFYEILSSYFQ